MFNQISKLAGIGFASTLALAVTANNAQALDFDFSFDNAVGNTPGTVEGTISGLSDNSTGAATSVTITSFPAGLEGTFDEGNDATLWEQQIANSFTVNNGSITAADFFAFGTTDDVFCFGNCVGNNLNILSFDNQTTFTSNQNGFAGATYSAASATAVPFGVSADLSILILGGLYGASRLRKKLAARK